MSHDAAAAVLPSPRETRAAMLWGVAVAVVLVAGPRDGLRARARGHRRHLRRLRRRDGRAKVIAVETGLAFAFVLVAATAVTGSPWLLVAGMAGHGLKDLWQHRTQFVSGTRWWPPLCMIVDWVVVAIIAAEIAAGPHFG